MPAMKMPDPTDFGGPKRPKNALFAFGDIHRAAIMADLKKKEAEGGEKFAITKVGGLLSEKFKALPAAESKKFQDAYDKQKAEYDAKLAEWKKTERFQEYEATRKNSKEAAGDKKQKAANKKKLKESVPENMPKKPIAAYFKFSTEVYSKVMEECKKAGNVTMGARAAKVKEMWNALSEADIKKREENYAKEKKQYEKDMAAFKETDEYKEYEELKKSLKKSSPKKKKQKVEDEEEEEEEAEDEEEEEEEE